MSELARNTTAAYNKGALANPWEECPYKWNKRQLISWWEAGREDRRRGTLDVNMLYDNTRRRLGLPPVEEV